MQLPSVPSAHSSRAAFRPRAPQPCRMQRAAAAAAAGLLGAASLHRGRSRPGRRDGQQQAAQESASRQPTKTSSSSAANTSAAREPAGMVGWGASQLLEFGFLSSTHGAVCLLAARPFHQGSRAEVRERRGVCRQRQALQGGGGSGGEAASCVRLWAWQHSNMAGSPSRGRLGRRGRPPWPSSRHCCPSKALPRAGEGSAPSVDALKAAQRRRQGSCSARRRGSCRRTAGPRPHHISMTSCTCKIQGLSQLLKAINQSTPASRKPKGGSTQQVLRSVGNLAGWAGTDGAR